MNEDWIEVELGEICFTTSGGTPSRNNTEYYQGTIPWVKSGELDKGIIYDTEEHISEGAVKNSSAKIFPKGTLLIALYGATIGKLAFLGVEATTNQAICGIYKSQAIDSKYLYSFLLNRKQKLISQGTGGAQPNISQTILKKLEISLPPLPIQRAIVSKIEALFSDLDNGIANLKKAQAQLKIYRQAVLKKAFEGELTKEWRALQQAQGTPLPTADELLQQIKEERQKHYAQQLEDWKKAVKDWETVKTQCLASQLPIPQKPSKPAQPKELPPLKAEELEELPTLPHGWTWVKLGFLSQKIQIGPFGTQLHKHDYINKGVPIINPKHIKAQKITPDIFISDEKANSLSQYLLKTNDVILGRRGEMGRTALITEKQNNWICGTGSLFIRFPENFVGKFYSLILSERRIVNYLNSEGSGTTMTNLNNSIINELPIQILSLPEQAQIVAEIERRLSVCDKVEQSISESLAKAESLRQSILKKAFEGKLLSQSEIAQCKKEADYEPASELLKKIKAEKLAKEQPKKKTKQNG